MLRKRTIKILVSVLIFAFIFFDFEKTLARGLTVDDDTVWTKDTPDLIFNEPVYVTDGATLTIEKGVTVKFENSGDESNPSGIFVSDGRLVADGTQQEKVLFTSDEEESNFVIFIYNFSKPSFFRWAEMSKAGCDRSGEIPPEIGFWRNLLGGTVFADESDIRSHNTCSALNIMGGNVHIENSIFRDNYSTNIDVSDEFYNDFENEIYKTFKANAEIVNSNFYGGNAVNSNITCVWMDEETWEEYYEPFCEGRAYLKENWLAPDDPETEHSEEAYISGTYQLDSSRSNEMIVDPVIIIPGIMGSAKVLGGWKMDPLLHTYDNLIASFEENGYEKDENLFEFPYEWRDSNILTADLLRQKIHQVSDGTKVSKVDLVAHSMGGLISRYYIEAPIYQNNVDQLIALGTPHRGSPEAYLKWEAAEGFEDPLDKIAKQIFKIEALHSGFTNLKKYIQTRVSSVQQLLPDYNYLYDVEENSMRSYANGYPQNTFLDFLNNEDKIANLNKVDLYNIYGNTEKDETISEFRVVESTKDGLWEHGMPENFYDVSMDKGIEYGEGDETVPIKSSNIYVNKTEEINSTHLDLPTEAQCYVISELTGMDYDDCDYVSTFERIKNILTFGVFSPVDIQIIAPGGEKVGKNFETGEIYDEIPGAYYTGYAGVENEFLTIPNPLDGEYKILTEGTGEGEYKIEVAKIMEDEGGEAEELTVEIAGTAEEGIAEEEKTLEVSEDEIKIQEQSDAVPPIITAQISSEPNENGWYNADVIVHFEAQDESGIKSITPDVILTEEGENQIAFGEAEDMFGNRASLIVENINIDKTAPVVAIISPQNTIYKNSQIVEIKYSAADNMNEPEKIRTEIFLDGEAISGNKIDLSLSHLGNHNLKISAKDEAGNASPESAVNFEVKTGIDPIIKNIGHYYSLNLITKKSAKLYLEAKLSAIRVNMELLKIFQARWMPVWAKKQAVKNLENKISRQIEQLIGDLERDKNILKTVSAETRELLIESLNYIKSSKFD